MTRKILRPILWLSGVTAFVAAGAWLVWFSTLNGGDRIWYFTSPPTEEHLMRRLGGERVVAILNNPERVEAVLLQEPKVFAGPYPEPDEYDVISDPQPVPPVVAHHISETLTTPQLHRMIDPGAKSCITRYGVRLSYYSANDRADFYFCFTCDDLAVYLNGKPVGLMQFLFICKRLLGDMQAIFPDHSEFAELAKHCHRRSN